MPTITVKRKKKRTKLTPLDMVGKSAAHKKRPRANGKNPPAGVGGGDGLYACIDNSADMNVMKILIHCVSGCHCMTFVHCASSERNHLKVAIGEFKELHLRV
jgi:hypothetical protein